MSSAPDCLFQTYLSACWGREYDTKLICALLNLERVEREIEAMDLPAGGFDPRHPDPARNLLQSAKDRVAVIHKRLETEYGGAREANRVIERHYARIDERRKSVAPAHREVFVIATLVDWVQYADGGKMPTPSRVARVIESLKAYAPFFKDITNDERLKLGRSEALRPMQYVVRWGARRAARHPHADWSEKRWREIYVQRLEGVARFIFDHGLFFGETVRVDRWLKPTPLRLTPGPDKSSCLFGVVNATTTPRHTSDG